MERHVMVMYVPSPSSKKMKDYIIAASNKALDYASSQKFTLALPVKISDDIPMKNCLKVLLYAIHEHMERRDTFGDVVLYVSDTPQLTDLIDITSEYLLECKDWDTEIPFRGCEHVYTNDAGKHV